jgi:hypothetical protein
MMITPSGEIQLPEAITSAEFLVMLQSGVVLSLTLPIFTPIAASFLVLFLTIPPATLGIGFPFRDPGVPMQYSLLVLLMLFGVNVLLTYFSETQKKQELIDMFASMCLQKLWQSSVHAASTSTLKASQNT